MIDGVLGAVRSTRLPLIVGLMLTFAAWLAVPEDWLVEISSSKLGHRIGRLHAVAPSGLVAAAAVLLAGLIGSVLWHVLLRSPLEGLTDRMKPPRWQDHIDEAHDQVRYYEEHRVYLDPEWKANRAARWVPVAQALGAWPKPSSGGLAPSPFHAAQLAETAKELRRLDDGLELRVTVAVVGLLPGVALARYGTPGRVAALSVFGLCVLELLTLRRRMMQVSKDTAEHLCTVDLKEALRRLRESEQWERDEPDDNSRSERDACEEAVRTAVDRLAKVVGRQKADKARQNLTPPKPSP